MQHRSPPCRRGNYLDHGRGNHLDHGSFVRDGPDHGIHQTSQENGSDNGNCMDHQQMRHVMTGLVSVLDGLRNVVGNIKSLVTHIDQVTDKMHQPTSSEDGSASRQNSSSTGKHESPSHDERYFENHHSCFHHMSMKTCSIESFYETIPAQCAGLGFQRDQDTNYVHVQNRDYAPDFNYHSKFRDKSSTNKDKKNTHHDYVNIVWERRKKVDKFCKTSKHHDYVNIDEIERYRSIDSGWFSSNNAQLGDSVGKNDRVKPKVSDLSRQEKRSESQSSNKVESKKPVKSQQKSMTDIHSPEEYSGVYEKEMEDSLEYEITESDDILCQTSDSTSFSSGSRQESDEYVEWERPQLDARVKYADVVAWTRTSWIGKNVYHVSLDHSIGFTENVPESESEHTDENQKWLTLV